MLLYYGYQLILILKIICPLAQKLSDIEIIQQNLYRKLLWINKDKEVR